MKSNPKESPKQNNKPIPNISRIVSEEASGHTVSVAVANGHILQSAGVAVGTAGGQGPGGTGCDLVWSESPRDFETATQCLKSRF